MENKKEQCIYGINPVREALRAGERKCYKIVVEEGKKRGRLRPILDLSRERGVKVETLPSRVFRQKYSSRPHQGVVACLAAKAVMNLDDMLEQAFRVTPHPALVLLDGIQDPNNLGAIIRSALALNVQGILLPRNRSVPLNETVARCSAGAVETLPVATVGNLVRSLETLKQAGFWTVAVDMAGEKPCDRFDFDTPVALVIGGEGKGVRPLLKKSCDFTVSIPMSGNLDSLNVSAAAAILFYEINRQKRRAKK